MSTWLKFGVYQGAVGIGLIGTLVEFVQGDVLGVLVAVGFSAIALTQIWRNNQGLKLALEADQYALRVAQRRGYSEQDAANSLLSAIEAVARLEGQTSLEFDQLIRCQNLRIIVGNTDQ